MLDDITPLRQVKADSTEQAAALFPVKDALLYVERHPLGGPRKGFQGDAFYTAENPPYGAMFTAYLKEKVKTKKEKRQDAEKDAAKKNQTLPYPSHDDLRAEDQEEKPEVYFIVYDESGAPIRQVEAATDSGFQRAAWDLRYPAGQMPKKSRRRRRLFPGCWRIKVRWCWREPIQSGCLSGLAATVTELGTPQII